jgi:hypothetical protein
VTEKETRFSFTSGFEAIPPQEARAILANSPTNRKKRKLLPDKERKGRNSDRIGNSDTFIGIFSIRLL